MAKKYCIISELQAEIFNTVFPGSFTLIFKVGSIKEKSESVCRYDALEHHSTSKNSRNIFTVYKNTLSVRVPNYKITKLLSKELGIPFTSTSANISGLPGSGNIQKILKQFKAKKNPPRQGLDLIDLVLDAGVLPKKNPSTIIDLAEKKPKIIRK